MADFGQAAFRQKMEEADIREDLHGLCKAVRSRRSNSNHRSYVHQSHKRNDRPDYATSRMWTQMLPGTDHCYHVRTTWIFGPSRSIPA